MTAQRQSGWWYPYIFVAAFVVVLIVNFTMAYFASTTFSGLATERPYEKGLAYNSAIEAARRQEEMGWTVDLKVEPRDNHAASVTVTYLDKAGKPVDDMKVEAEFVRPTAKGHDSKVALAHVAPGTYAVIQPLPLAGVWDLGVIARGADASYQLSRRIVAP